MTDKKITLYYEAAGKSGETVVLLPGMLATTKFWQPLINKLKSKYRLIAVDTLGFGRSPSPKNLEYTKEEHADALYNTFQKLNIKNPVTIIGHSMGGLLGINFANRYPHLVKKLILLAPPIFFSEQEAETNISKHSFLPKILLYGLTARIACFIFCSKLRGVTKLWLPYLLKNLPRQISEETLLHTYHSYSKTLENIVMKQNIIEEIRRLKIPLEMIYGLNDRRIKVNNLQVLKSYKKDLTVHEYQDLRHQFPLTKTGVIEKIL